MQYPYEPFSKIYLKNQIEKFDSVISDIIDAVSNDKPLGRILEQIPSLLNQAEFNKYYDYHLIGEVEPQLIQRYVYQIECLHSFITKEELGKGKINHDM